MSIISQIVLTISLSINVLLAAVLVDNEELLGQMDYAIQYLGKERCELESSIAEGLCLPRLDPKSYRID